MENAAGQLAFALAAAAFAVGAIAYLLLGLKKLNSGRREYEESLDRDEGQQKLAYLRANNLECAAIFFRAAALCLAAGLAIDVFRGHVFWTYPAVIITAAVAVAWFSKKKYRARLKKELGLDK